MDVHVKRAVTNGLRLRGVAALTAMEDRRERLSDSELLDPATELNRPRRWRVNKTAGGLRGLSSLNKCGSPSVSALTISNCSPLRSILQIWKIASSIFRCDSQTGT